MKRDREERDNEPSPYYRQDERVTLVVSEREPKDLRDSVPASRMVAIAPTDIPLDVKTVFVNKIWLHMTLKDIISLARTSRAFYLIMRQTRPYQMMLWMRDKYLDLNLEIGRAMRHAAKRNLFQGGYHCLQYLLSKIRVGLGVLVDPVYYAARCGQLENVILILGFAFGLIGKREFSVGALLSMPPSRSLALETIGFEKDTSPLDLSPVANHTLPETAYIPKKLSKELVLAVLEGSILTRNGHVFHWGVQIILRERRDSGWDSEEKACWENERWNPPLTSERAPLDFKRIILAGLSIGNEEMALDLCDFTIPRGLGMEPMSDTIKNARGPISCRILVWMYWLAIVEVAASCEPGMSLKKKEELIDRYEQLYRHHRKIIIEALKEEEEEEEVKERPLFSEHDFGELYLRGVEPVLFKRFLMEYLEKEEDLKSYRNTKSGNGPVVETANTNIADVFRRFHLESDGKLMLYHLETDLSDAIIQTHPVSEGAFYYRSRDELQKFKNRHGCMKILRTVIMAAQEKLRPNLDPKRFRPGSFEYLKKIAAMDKFIFCGKFTGLHNPASPYCHWFHKEATESLHVLKRRSRSFDDREIADLFFQRVSTFRKKRKPDAILPQDPEED